ncbi:MAG: hypothetical protein JWR66_3342, partial [Modestobacter sp.]|nr:hypothetical protein [Modestobacter sp.]MCW2577312.1 hypothetical protein [Modestobacter sp.]
LIAVAVLAALGTERRDVVFGTAAAAGDPRGAAQRRAG